MSSTRTAKDDSVFHQNRYASSTEFERGLIANLVAKRCSLLDDTADRELIWFVQYLSHQDGGLAAVAKDLIKKHPGRIQTAAMSEIGMKPGKICNSEEVKKLRPAFLDDVEDSFSKGELADQLLLKGESVDSHGECELVEKKNFIDPPEFGGEFDVDRFQIEQEKSLLHPTSYPASKFIEMCLSKADRSLKNYLREICLDPGLNFKTGAWYFPGLIAALREYQDQFVKTKNAGIVTTALGAKVCEVLDYTFFCRGLTLLPGEARMGKTFAARAWCEQHPGQARFVEVPPSNDEGSFFRALARGLGLGNFLQYKAAEIRERVESVLLTGDLMLVLDEAQRLWPQKNLRYGFPSRILWVMAMANHSVPICAITTPQFIALQKAAEEKGQWNSAQLTGRISHYEALPADLSPDDLMAVAKSVLPEANSQVLRALAVYARSSARYLAAIDSISKRARYIAMRAGRATATTDDVRKAMQESVIPADTKLQCALENGRTGKHGKMTPAPAQPARLPESLLPSENESENFQSPRGRGNQTVSAPPIRVPEASFQEA
jgi:histone H3/H4